MTTASAWGVDLRYDNFQFRASSRIPNGEWREWIGNDVEIIPRNRVPFGYIEDANNILNHLRKTSTRKSL